MAIRFNIDYIESSNTTMSSEPVVSWTYYDSDSNATQTGSRINIMSVDTGEYITGSVATAFEPNGNAAFAQSFKCPVLKPGYYRFGLRVRGSMLVTEGTTSWSPEYFYYFYVIKWEEKEIRWEANDSSVNSFNKYFTFTNLDINTNSERIKLSSTGITYAIGEYTTEYRITGQTDVAWQTISATTIIPTGTSVTLFGRASNSIMSDSSSPVWIEITNNSLVGLVGEYLQIKAVLTPDDTTTITPTLNSLLITYIVPATSSTTSTVTIDCDLSKSYLLNNTEYKDNAVQLKTLDTIYTYVNSGVLSTLFDATLPVVFTSIDIAKTTPSDSNLVVKSRLYNDVNNKPDFSAAITPVGTNYTLPYQSYQTGNAKLYRYCEVLYEFTSATDFKESPYIENITLNYSDIIDTTVNYFYTTNISFPSNIKKIFYTGNDNNLTTSFCNVEYGISLKDSKVWSDYTIYEKNKLLDAIAVQSNNMRIGVKLSSNSLVYFPILHEIGFIVETINGDKVYLNV